MDTDTNEFMIRKTARFAQIGNKKDPEVIWFVLHGYGQLCYRFIRRFTGLNMHRQLIIAPEGLHRYYLQGSSGHVGASWMTKESRLTDIRDYVEYLDGLSELIVSRTESTSKIAVLGFSQGAATASRWVSQGNIKPDQLILWGSVFPPDMDFSLSLEKLNSTDITLVMGDEDEYHSAEQFNEHASFLKDVGLKFSSIIYSGGHNIFSDPLFKIQNSMIFA